MLAILFPFKNLANKLFSICEAIGSLDYFHNNSYQRPSNVLWPYLIEIHQGKHGLNGEIQSFNDITSCLEACKQQSQCLAVDFDTADDSCWFHKDAGVLCLELFSRETVTHYRFVSCCKYNYNL